MIIAMGCICRAEMVELDKLVRTKRMGEMLQGVKCHLWARLITNLGTEAIQSKGSHNAVAILAQFIAIPATAAAPQATEQQ